MIKSFADKETAALFAGKRVKRWGPDLMRQAQRKLAMLNRAGSLDDLRMPPGNRLETLSGDRDGQCSIRINDQWRLCFEWREGQAWNVLIVDYH
ncbi:MAG: type II toxin-antitoxin system RelE/ParE family toxin [Thiocapsa sp.]|uniref:type II toxin-antitoxin system RelE/ParE family toxin n=1 Tax=Thiocapsa sp. TaxID=2024551 RepID=UPI001BCD809C|nr:type II toxin-antitoxin system RelE/ParE family toxin [Thiocapsa sp.]QVL49834.1 MAG: type II toxin-antitoxin system RelE/ParE family toxin [Thiocapsa sp.]